MPPHVYDFPAIAAGTMTRCKPKFALYVTTCWTGALITKAGKLECGATLLRANSISLSRDPDNLALRQQTAAKVKHLTMAAGRVLKQKKQRTIAVAYKFNECGLAACQNILSPTGGEVQTERIVEISISLDPTAQAFSIAPARVPNINYLRCGSVVALPGPRKIRQPQGILTGLLASAQGAIVRRI